MFERRPGRTTIHINLVSCGKEGVCPRRLSTITPDGSIPDGAILQIQGRPESENKYISQHAQEIKQNYKRSGFLYRGTCDCPEANGIEGLVGICFIKGTPLEED